MYLIAVAQRLDARRRRRLHAVGEAVVRIDDLDDVALDFNAGDIGSPCRPSMSQAVCMTRRGSNGQRSPEVR